MATEQMAISTPLRPGALRLTGFHGSEGISQLFRFHLDLVADNQTDVPFDKLLGQPVTVHLALPKGKMRHWNGIVSRMSQGERDDAFTTYRMEMVPLFWLWSRRVQSRLFQHQSVPEIIKEVLHGLDVKYEIQGTFHPRNYCTQYAESDFAFASRLMEDEGIWYYFKHADGAHQLVVANTPPSHVDVVEYPKAIFDTFQGGQRQDDRVWGWAKTQELCSGKYTLWDHTFELPGKNLAAETLIADSVAIGKVTHKLKVAGNDKLETYLFPGGYAHRFDGIDRSGGERPAELQKIFEDNQRTCRLRMEAEAVHSLKIEGASACRQFTSGHKFTLERHFNADGTYVLLTVEHDARLAGDWRGSTEQSVDYRNAFTCIPVALPFRPCQSTPKPLMQGTQTATVVGPAGEEIHCDKYGRVKVQFHWDRLGKFDGDSSCWVRVAYSTAGRGFGLVVVPRVGQEVVVDFEGGDPDEPVVIGTVFNNENMPPNELPGERATLTLRSSTYPGGAGCNEISLRDNDGDQRVYVHAQKDMNTHVKNDKSLEVEKNESQKVGIDRTVEVGQNHQEKIGVDRSMKIGGNESKDIGLNLLQNIGANVVKNVMATATENVGLAKTIVVGALGGLGGLSRGLGGTGPSGRFQTIVHGQINVEAHTNLIELIKQNHETKVNGYKQAKVDGKYFIGVAVDGAASGEPAGSFTSKAKTIKLEATDKIELICGASKITLLPKQTTINCAKQKIDLHEGGIIEVTGAACDIVLDEEVNIDSKKIQLEAQNVLEMSGKSYSLDTSGGDGEIKAQKMVKVKAPQVHINC